MQKDRLIGKGMAGNRKMRLLAGLSAFFWVFSCASAGTSQTRAVAGNPPEPSAAAYSAPLHSSPQVPVARNVAAPRAGQDEAAQAEDTARKAEAAGNLGLALRWWINAAVKATGPRMEKYGEEARRVLATMNLTVVSLPQDAKVGVPLAEELVVAVRGPAESVQPGIPLRVGGLDGPVLNTDNEGLVRYRDSTAPAAIGTVSVEFTMETESLRSEIADLNEAARLVLAPLDKDLSSKKLVVEFPVKAAVQPLPTVVVIADRNDKGDHIRFSSIAQNIFIEELKTLGFVIGATKIGPKFMQGKELAEIVYLTDWAVGNPKVNKRFLYGNVQSRGAESGGVSSVTANGEIWVVDTATKSVIAKVVAEAQAEGANRKEAQQKATALLAKDIALKLAGMLP